MVDFEHRFGPHYGGPLSFYYDNTPDRKMGYYLLSSCEEKIKINTYYWPQISDLQKTFLMYHEIAHAVGVKHVDGDLEDGCAKSIMNPIFNFYNNCFDIHYDYYIEELASHL